MAKDPVEEFASPLLKKPEYLQTIGLVSVEVNSMESMLASLFASAIGVQPLVGRAIYYAPKAASARIDVLMAGAEQALATRPKVQDRVLSLAKRAKGVLEERNAIVHDMWALPPDTDAVHRYKKGDISERIPANLTELERITATIRELTVAALFLMARIILDKGDTLPWPDTPAEQRKWLRENPLQNPPSRLTPDTPAQSSTG